MLVAAMMIPMITGEISYVLYDHDKWGINDFFDFENSSDFDEYDGLTCDELSNASDKLHKDKIATCAKYWSWKKDISSLSNKLVVWKNEKEASNWGYNLLVKMRNWFSKLMIWIQPFRSCHFLGLCLVSWLIKKQIWGLIYAEAEYIATGFCLDKFDGRNKCQTVNNLKRYACIMMIPVSLVWQRIRVNIPDQVHRDSTSFYYGSFGKRMSL